MMNQSLINEANPTFPMGISPLWIWLGFRWDVGWWRNHLLFISRIFLVFESLSLQSCNFKTIHESFPQNRTTKVPKVKNSGGIRRFTIVREGGSERAHRTDRVHQWSDMCQNVPLTGWVILIESTEKFPKLTWNSEEVFQLWRDCIDQGITPETAFTSQVPQEKSLLKRPNGDHIFQKKETKRGLR